ncbi:MAG: alpha/beta hydrolase, partial [Clostridia bacterium]
IKGYFAKHNGWDALLDDTHALRTQVHKEFPNLPYFMLGHSMGSFVMRGYCLKYEQGLRGVILSGTGHFDPPIVAVGGSVAGLQCALGMGEKPSKVLHNLVFSANNKQFENPRTDCDWLTRDPAQVDLYVADPQCGFVFTARGYRDMFSGLKRLYPKRIGAMKKDIPVLIFSGALDPVGKNGSGVQKVADEIRAVGVKDLTLKLYPEARHELFNELNKEEVWEDLIAWLNARLPRK